ncbi:MAG: hypothetical protein UH625_06845, partial [Muribaculaceae bacterium]|nr:hypothetical protein [Muribaculaceae bacterium]
MLKTSMALLMGAVFLASSAQSVVNAGSATYASEPPAYKAKTDQHDGFNASRMMTREIYCDEQPGHPIPTNDWWTDIINSRYSGALWSYPAMLRTGDYGVQINYPSVWADEGKEMKPLSSITVGGVKFTPEATIATDWNDWGVVFRMPSAIGELRCTAVHGQPFTWFETSGITLRLSCSSAPRFFGRDDSRGHCGVQLGNDLYGLYYPADASISPTENQLKIDNAQWIVVALLNSAADLEKMAPYATSIPHDTRVDFRYDQQQALVKTTWTVKAENLRDPDAPAPVMQGFLPHVHKYALNSSMVPNGQT